MTDVGITAVVVGVFALITAWVASRYARDLRPLVWWALVEYAVCTVAQYYFGMDARSYRVNGLELARFLDIHFGWASHELWLLLFQQPSAFDRVVLGAGTNTGSMSAMSGWLMFIVRGSPYACHAVVAGCAMLGAIALFDVVREECPDVPPRRLFLGTVLFPSIAFWTASLHKESFCVVGIGLFISAWRAVRKGKLRALLYGVLGLTVIVLFRAPALPPLLLGIVFYFIVERIQKARRLEVIALAPAYLIIGLVVLIAGMVVVSRISPNLAIDKLGDSVSEQQRAWSGVEAGSSFGSEDDGEQPTSLAGQLVTAPFALLNALLRPQLFDVRNPLMLVSAIEMSVVTVLLVRAIVSNGVRGIVRRIQSSPFLVMCTIIILVGFTFVGLTTRNFGSMARYRVPFLPFYGTFLAVFTLRRSRVASPLLDAPRTPLVPNPNRSRRARSSD